MLQYACTPDIVCTNAIFFLWFKLHMQTNHVSGMLAHSGTWDQHVMLSMLDLHICCSVLEIVIHIGVTTYVIATATSTVCM